MKRASNYRRALRIGGGLSLVPVLLALSASPTFAQSYRNSDPFQPTRSIKSNGTNTNILAGVGSAALIALWLYSMHQDMVNCKEYDRYNPGRCSKNY